MSALHRRDFLRTAIPIGLAIQTGQAAPPPRKPQAKAGTGLPILPGEADLALPSGATGRLGTTRMRLPGYVNRLAFSPKGTTLVVASGKELRGWDPKTGKVLFRVDYPADSSVNSGRLTTGDTFALLLRANQGNTSTFCQFAFGTGKLVSSSPPLTLGNTQSNAFSIDGSLLLVVQQDAMILLDSTSGKEKWKETLPSVATDGCCIFDDNSKLALASQTELKLYSADTGKHISTLKVDLTKLKEPKNPGNRERDWIGSPVPSPDGKWIAAMVGDAKNVGCWNLITGKMHYLFDPAAKLVGFDNRSTELATSFEGVVTFWNLQSGKSRTLQVPDVVELSPDGTILAADCEDSAVLIDAKTGKFLPHSADPPGLPDGLRFTHTTLIGRLPSWGGWVEWDLKTGRSRTIQPMKVSGWTPISISRDGSRAVYRRDTFFELRTIANGEMLAKLTLESFGRSHSIACLTPDGTKLLGLRPDGLVVASASGKEIVLQVPEKGNGSGEVAISENGQFVAVGTTKSDGRGAVSIFDFGATKLLRTFETSGEATRLAWTPDGSWLAVAHAGERDANQRFGSSSGAATVFDLSTGKPALKIPQDQQQEQCIAISRDGRMLARLDADDKIAIWEVLSGGIRRRLEAGGTVASLAFTADGTTLAASVRGAPIFLWNLHAAKGWKIPPTPADFESAWVNLQSADAALAFSAIRLLAAHPRNAIPFLKEHARPIVAPEADLIRKWIGDLDHREFRKRELASKTLSGMGEKARGPLRDKLVTRISQETRDRIERLLAAEDKLTPDQLRLVRCVEAMEIVGTPEAQELLGHWALGAPGAIFTTAASAARSRLAEQRK